MGKRLVILGGGESGAGAALLGRKMGYDVFLSDQSSLKEKYRTELQAAGIAFEEGQVSEDRILAADEIMKSPGIPEKNPLVKKIRERGIPVISEIELAYRHAGNSTIIAITGSNGKTTTTALTFHICESAGLPCALVGNIGYSFARQVAEDPKPLYVAEISSFQLDDIKTFRPHVAILTNITEDHLDRLYDRVVRGLEHPDHGHIIAPDPLRGTVHLAAAEGGPGAVGRRRPGLCPRGRASRAAYAQGQRARSQPCGQTENGGGVCVT